ncbi:hypothetical protein GGR50DRAFT_519844 [Xylaria sp. CBS 124048]|nr:hypothetical protein GGR50DRAFT_519844 [Xylaria sp. CBS 124048]
MASEATPAAAAPTASEATPATAAPTTSEATPAAAAPTTSEATPAAAAPTEWNAEAFTGANGRAISIVLQNNGRRAANKPAGLNASEIEALERSLQILGGTWASGHPSCFYRQVYWIHLFNFNWGQNPVIRLLREKPGGDLQALNLIREELNLVMSNNDYPQGSLWLFLADGMEQAIRGRTSAPVPAPVPAPAPPPAPAPASE